VITSGSSQEDLTVEVYPLRLRLIVIPKGSQATLKISKKVFPIPYFIGIEINLYGFDFQILIVLVLNVLSITLSWVNLV
jgi:hypothetical protein